MAKKKADKEPKKMTAAQYWEWKCSIEELKVSKINEKRVNLEHEIMNKDIENKKLRLALFRETVKSARSSTVKCQENFEKIKQKIEDEIGVSLEDCAIDPYTFEIKKID